jgi:hypothetical protein
LEPLPIGLDPDASHQIIDDPRRLDRVLGMDVSSNDGAHHEVLRANPASACLIGSLVTQDSILAVGFDYGPVQVCGAGICSIGHAGQDA